jgi:hypothetical protein
MKKQKETQEEYQKANFSNQPANVVAKVCLIDILVVNCERCSLFSLSDGEESREGQEVEQQGR